MADEQPEDRPADRPTTSEVKKEAKRRETLRDESDINRSDFGFDDVPRGEGREDTPRSSRLARLGRRLLNSGDDVRDLASAVLDSGDRAKTEMVRMVAREVRTYLDELKLKDDVRDLVTKHSLEVHMSFSLKPLVESKDAPADKKTGGNG